ncbi:MAG: type II toxin-antitoxin system MqsA family antitoxin [Kiloniellales bacterium]
MIMVGKKQQSALGKDLIDGMKEAVAHARGEIELPTRVVEVPETVDVAAIRKRLRLSQERFAEYFGFTVASVREWEQKRRRPERTARVLLRVIDRDPEAVLRALHDM